MIFKNGYNRKPGGQMPIRQRYGYWNIRFWVNGHEFTEPTDLVATERNRTAAQRIEAELRKRVLEGKQHSLKLKVKPFSEAATHFLCWAEGEHREHPSTARRLRTSFTSLSLFFKSSAVSAITTGHVEDYKAWRRQGEERVREITLRHDLHALSKFFRYAMKHNWANDNPVRGVTIPSDMDAVRMHVLTPNEERLYFETARSEFTIQHKDRISHHGPFRDLYDVARLILLQGCRPDEITRRRPEEINLEGPTMQIVSGKSRAARRNLRLHAESVEILAPRVSKGGKWIFPGKKPGEALTKLNGAHAKVLQATGLRFVLYDLRHTFATRMAESGCQLATLAAILGHANLRSISKYVHPSEKEQHAAMESYQRHADAVRSWSGPSGENRGKASIIRELSGGVSPNEIN
jgi:integrase